LVRGSLIALSYVTGKRNNWSLATMPFKHNAARRHRIGKMKFKIANWAEYEAGLRRRGSLTLWMTAEALSSWQAPKRTTRGGQLRYSDLAIETALTLGLVFGLRLRQTEGGSVANSKLRYGKASAQFLRGQNFKLFDK
jgi:hypothetical protein